MKSTRVVFNQVRTEELTHVLVLDRDWATDVLSKSSAARRKNVAWLRKVAEAVRDGAANPLDLPVPEGATRRAGMNPVVLATFFDDATEKQNADRKVEERLKPIFATVERDPGFNGREKTIRIRFTFSRYSPNRVGGVMTHPKAKPAAPPREAGISALALTPFSDLGTELNALLLQEEFPPKAETVELVRPKSGPAYYEWQTADHWKVICDFNDGVTLEKREAKDL